MRMLLYKRGCSVDTNTMLMCTDYVALPNTVYNVILATLS